MNKKKRIAILFAVILVVAVGIIIAVTSHQKKEMDFDGFADRFEKSAEEVLGEDLKESLQNGSCCNAYLRRSDR